MTLADARWRNAGRLKELTRLREVLCDFFYGDNAFQTTSEDLRKYSCISESPPAATANRIAETDGQFVESQSRHGDPWTSWSLRSSC